MELSIDSAIPLVSVATGSGIVGTQKTPDRRAAANVLMGVLMEGKVALPSSSIHTCWRGTASFRTEDDARAWSGIQCSLVYRHSWQRWLITQGEQRLPL